MIQSNNNKPQLADFLLQFGIAIKQSIPTFLPNYGLIKISGIDAAIFLQNQLTCNITKISTQPSLGAMCNAQGRVECVFKIFKTSNDFYMQIIKEQLLPTINNLSKYILRSKVTLQQEKQEINQDDNDKILWEIKEISEKIPEIYLTTTQKFLPHNINLVNLGAVSLDKGCYKGQSIISRMQYLGKIKKELKIIAVQTTKTLTSLIPGNKLDNTEATIVRSVALNNTYQLALIETNIISPLDACEETATHLELNSDL